VLVEGGTLIVGGTVSGGFNGNGSGPVDAVYFRGTANGTLILDPGAVFNGVVNGNGHGLLELAVDTIPTTLTGLGTEFIGFNQISIAAGGIWTLPGTFVAGTGDAAVIAASNVTLTTLGSVSGGGGLYGTATRPGGAGGAAIMLGFGDSLANQGTISGGNGAYGSGSPGGGAGGVGIAMSADDTVTNFGTMSGGTLTNSGSILGGSGGREAANGLAGSAGGVASGGYGVDLTAGGRITNDGTITGGFLGSGIYLNAASLTNNKTIAGGYRGDGAHLANGSTVTNLGTIDGGMAYGNADVNGVVTGPIGNGVVLESGSTLTNEGTITAGFAGAGAALTDSTLTNDQFIAGGGYGDGASLTAGASMTNNGTIIGGGGPYSGRLSVRLGDFGKESIGAGVALSATATLTNNGTIIGGVDAVGAYLAAGATLTNSGLIGSAYGYGAHLTTGARMINAGLILGSRAGGAYLSGGTLLNTGTIESGLYSPGVFLNGGTLINSGTIAGQASFQIVEPPRQGPNKFYPGGTYTVPGFAAVQFGSMAATLLVDPGAVFLDGIAATPTVSDTLELGTGSFAGTLAGLGSSITGFGTIEFDQGAHWFLGGNTVGLTGTIDSFAQGDTIEVGGITVTGTSYANGVLTLTDTTGTATLKLPGPFTSNDFLVTNVADGADISLGPICYLAGTLIATPEGEVEVERLAPGGTVLTLSGAARRVVWVGTGRVLATRGRRNAATPVIVRKGALGDNVPHTDLRVTKAHSLYIDGVLVPVEFLVNHRTILWDDHAQEVTIYHIELETHDVLLANGAPAESYRDDGNRWLFQNANDGWDGPPTAPCAPVLTGGAVVDAIWQRLLDRTPPRRGVPLTDDADLHLLVDGRRLDATERAGEVHVFQVPEGLSALRIASRAAAPDELGLARDPRVLGVAIHRIVLRKGTRFQVVNAADERLSDGFHAFEAASGVRWTDGDAVVPTCLHTGLIGPFEVVVHVGATTRYLADDAADRVA
jgi:hypothetical protein